MENAKQYELLVNLYKIFKEKTDKDHPLSTPELQLELEDQELHADRRTIYKCFETLNQLGFHIEMIKAGRKTAYYMSHLFTTSESFVLLETIDSSSAFSIKESKKMKEKILTTLSEYETQSMPPTFISPLKSKSDDLFKNIDLLLHAIKECKFVEFRYFDLTIKKEKKYRKNEGYYHLTPYAIVSENAKYYCVFYDHKHHGFSNYRLDKMEHLRLTDEKDKPVSFSLKNHMRDSMQMYHGKPQTITVKFNSNMATKVYEQFTDIIISEVKEDYFIANIRTTLSPTLTSWFMLYYDQVEIIKPQSLIDEMLVISKHIQKTYGGKKE